MQNFLITYVVAGDVQYNMETQFIGSVELRNSSVDTPQEREALKKSSQTNSETVDLDKSMRLSIIVSADSLEDAHTIAREYFSEILDIWSLFGSFMGQSVRLTNSAFSKNMLNNEIQPFIKYSFPMNCFVRQIGPFQPVTLFQLISGKKDDFTKRIKRFCHWVRKSYTEEDRQLKILFLWFSLEALLKENEDDNIAPYISMLIGFCSTKESPQDWASLRENKDYGKFRRVFVQKIDEIRKFRNDSVHSGFVPWEILEEDTKLYFFILSNATMRIRLALESFYNVTNYSSDVPGFKNFLEKNIPLLPNYKPWFNGTFLFSYIRKEYLNDIWDIGCIK